MNGYSVSNGEIPPPKMIPPTAQSNHSDVSTQRNSTVFQRLDLTQNHIQKRKHSPEKSKPEEMVKKPKSASAIPLANSLGRIWRQNNVETSA